ncbi:MAG: FAA hydrolase family protein [Marinilabiliales bacterium]|nr:MAG: FAA hydrolase family protein [Marinilabiliales bacterium]
MKIICIGRNYADHARELNNPVPEKPVFFLKPDTSLVLNNRPFFYPDFSSNIHHEVEIVIRINRLGRNIDQRFAHRYYDEITAGIDFTARDLQDRCKEKGLPWEISKAFDNSAPLGRFVKKSETGDPGNIPIRLDINGKTVQEGSSSQMIFSFDHIISYISQFITLKIGDLIFTGTPAGVGPVSVGDRLQAWLNDEMLLDFYVK